LGSINMIWNPVYWKICFEGKSKITEGDIIYKMIIGEGEDFYSYDITEFISKCNYDNLIRGKYSIMRFPYSEFPILLFNERNELIPLVLGDKIKYTEYQQDYLINKNNENNIFIKK